MKSTVNNTLNKLIAYAFDNLLLDIPDGTYMLNRLATLCGALPEYDENADYGDQTLGSLLAELKAAAPDTDINAVADMLFPMPRTVNYYFDGKLSRGTVRAFEFLFELYAKGYNNVSVTAAEGKNGYFCYSPLAEPNARPISLEVGETLAFTPIAVGNRIGALDNPDILTDEVVSREVAYVSAYGGTIAARIGSDADYLCCSASALGSAKIKTQLSDGTVKIALLDYPVPVLSFNGIAKNAVAREATRIVKAATDKGLPCVVATAAVNGITVYVIFAGELAANDILLGSDALAACGVFATKDCSPLLPVLEKGTALSTDLAQFRPIYDKIGGVKLGAKAVNALGETLAEMSVPSLKAAASADEAQVCALVKPQ